MTAGLTAIQGDDSAGGEPVLAGVAVDQVREPSATLAGLMDAGNGDDAWMIRQTIAGRSYAELQAMALLLADCADPAKITRACGISPGTAAANARRKAEASHRRQEYAWLRDGGVVPEFAAQRVGVTAQQRISELEASYQKRLQAPEGGMSGKTADRRRTSPAHSTRARWEAA